MLTPRWIISLLARVLPSRDSKTIVIVRADGPGAHFPSTPFDGHLPALADYASDGAEEDSDDGVMEKTL